MPLALSYFALLVLLGGWPFALVGQCLTTLGLYATGWSWFELWYEARYGWRR